MYKKKSSLLVVAVLLLSMVLTGCNANTLGFINHLEEIQTVAANNAIQTVSTVSISNIKTPAQLLNTKDKALVATANRILDTSYIAITQKSDVKQNIASITFDLVEKKMDKADNLITLKYKDEAFAISVGPKLNELYPGITTILAPVNNKLIPLSTIEELFGDTTISLNALSNPKSIEALNEKSITFLKEVMAIYKEADTSLITKEGKDFILQVDTNDFIKLIDTFVTLTIKNFDTIITATGNFMDSLTSEEFSMMYGTMFPEGKTEVVNMLKEAKDEFAEEEMTDQLLVLWTQMYPESADMMSTMLEGSSLRMRTWKENNKYFTNLYSIIKITDPSDPEIVFNANILIKEETQVITEELQITMPTEEVNKELMKSLIDNI